MGAFTGESLGERLRNHFGHRHHLYGVLLDEIGLDWERGGVGRDILAGWEQARPQALPQLRLLAGLFRVVLRGAAPDLAEFYPCLGGLRDPEQVWPIAQPVIEAYAAELRSALDVHPQTNEVGRCVALHVGLVHAVRATGLSRVRLLEPGASGGLGLQVDRVRLLGEGWRAGPADSGLVIEGCGARGLGHAAYDIVHRAGCDIDPVDASTPEGAAYLTSFVWPFHIDRHERLRAALALARAHPVVLDRAPASSWVRERLAEPVPDGVLTVVWHSVTRIYWPRAETQAMEAAIEEARGRIPVVHIAMEHPWDGSTPQADAGELPVIEVDGVRLGHCGHHGPPVALDH